MYSRPQNDEIEVSLFGPGYGESVVLHIGSNQWIIVDSCLDPTSQSPVPLNYLNKIDIKPKDAVKQIVATHWHDDHIRGIAEIFRICERAEFVCSAALQTKEFLALCTAYGIRPQMNSTGIDEFSEILQILDKRSSNSNYVVPKFASSDKVIFKNDFCTITSLSPSDVSLYCAVTELADLIPKKETRKLRLFSQTPNHLAVVLWVKIKNHNILLGSDLEETGKSGTGWSVIVSSTTRPRGKASLFKIPHHGSQTGDSPSVWTELLENNPVAILTPFSRHSLPTKKDISRILSNTSRGYSTSPHSHTVPRKKAKVVEKQIKEVVRNYKQVDYSKGHVRLRAHMNKSLSDWSIDLFDGAVALENFYN